MQFSNETYDRLNKFHRGLLGILTAVSALITLVGVLTEQGIAVPHLATITTVLAICKVVLGELLTISSKEYWDNIGSEE